MVRRVRSHDLDKRLAALGFRLVRQEPETYASWAIIPTRRRVYFSMPNLDAVQSVIERMEEALWLEFGRWLGEHHITIGKLGAARELGQAENFLKNTKGMASEHVAVILRKWYEPTE